jgi:tRNA modification GTPase
MNTAYSVRTPSGVGAIAAIDLVGEVSRALSALNIRQVPVGVVALRDLCGIDRGLVARWNDRACTLMPHGGAAVVRALCAALNDACIAQTDPAPLDAFPEAADEIEAMALLAIARTESPCAVELLLDQSRRWRAWSGKVIPESMRARSTTLDRLLTPPIIAVIGATNIGKSSLLNALARRDVSIAHDAPGVTSDHVGATLVLDGLAVRWLDLPGLAEEGPADDDASRAALRAAQQADLLVLCADAGSGWVEPAAIGLDRPTMTIIRVGLRGDRGPVAGASLMTSAARSEGLAELAVGLRRALIPDEALTEPGPWIFDRRLASPRPAIVRP